MAMRHLAIIAGCAALIAAVVVIVLISLPRPTGEETVLERPTDDEAARAYFLGLGLPAP